MLLLNANIMTMDGDDIPCGFVRVLRGRIAAVGDMIACPTPDPAEEQLDVHGGTVLPGFIDAHSHIGLMADGLGVEGDDINEESDPATPHLRAVDGINPLDRCFTEAWQNGVTCAVVSPGSANPIGGQICAMKTCGRWVDKMTIKEPLAIKFALGENPKMNYGGKSLTPYTRMATAAIIRENLSKAYRYLRDKDAAESDPDLDEPDFDARLEALIPLLRGDIRAHFHAHRAYDILSAVRIAEEFGLDYTLIHCTEGHIIADILAELGADVVCGPLICSRTKPELSGLTEENPAKLVAAGVNVAICTDHPEVPISFLASSAAVAVTAGMDRRKALEAITINAARAVDLDSRIGSVTIGKDADLLVFDTDPLAMCAKPSMVWIEGHRIM